MQYLMVMGWGVWSEPVGDIEKIAPRQERQERQERQSQPTND
jgi:hypothetical protein